MWRWTGYVSEVLEGTFKVILEDQTVSSNPAEEWEIGIDKLRSDQRPLLCEGRIVEVNVGENVFSLEFIVSPLDEATSKRIKEEASQLAALLEAD